MNPISDLITKKADAIFAHSPPEILDLENYDETNEEVEQSAVQPEENKINLPKLKNLVYALKGQLDKIIETIENITNTNK